MEWIGTRAIPSSLDITICLPFYPTTRGEISLYMPRNMLNDTSSPGNLVPRAFHLKPWRVTRLAPRGVCSTLFFQQEAIITVLRLYCMKCDARQLWRWINTTSDRWHQWRSYLWLGVFFHWIFFIFAWRNVWIANFRFTFWTSAGKQVIFSTWKRTQRKPSLPEAASDKLNLQCSEEKRSVNIVIKKRANQIIHRLMKMFKGGEVTKFNKFRQ